MQNVVTLKTKHNKPFASLWPKRPLEAVASVLAQNQLVTDQDVIEHLFAIKTDMSGDVCTIVVQPNRTILFSGDASRVGDSPFSRWLNLNDGTLRQLSEEGFTGVIVGKTTLGVHKEPIFVVYYIIKGDLIIVDLPSISKMLRLDDNLFSGMIRVMPVKQISSVVTNKINGTTDLTDVSLTCKSTSVIGIPVTFLHQNETPTNYGATPPKVTSSPTHMVYMGFRYNA